MLSVLYIHLLQISMPFETSLFSLSFALGSNHYSFFLAMYYVPNAELAF